MVGSLSQQKKKKKLLQRRKKFSSLLMWSLSYDTAQGTGSSVIQRLQAPCSICPISATKAGEREEVEFDLFWDKKKLQHSRTHINNLLVCSTLKPQHFLHLPWRKGGPRKAPFYPSFAKTIVRKMERPTSISPVRLQAGLSPQQANPQSSSAYTVVLIDIIQGMDTHSHPMANTSMFKGNMSKEI